MPLGHRSPAFAGPHVLDLEGFAGGVAQAAVGRQLPACLGEQLSGFEQIAAQLHRVAVGSRRLEGGPEHFWRQVFAKRLEQLELLGRRQPLGSEGRVVEHAVGTRVLTVTVHRQLEVIGEAKRFTHPDVLELRPAQVQVERL